MHVLGISGKSVLVGRGSCNFTTKAQHAQDAGALMMVVANSEGMCVLFLFYDGRGNIITLGSYHSVHLPKYVSNIKRATLRVF